MYCQHCGKSIPDESIYCMWCGSPIAGRGGADSVGSAEPAYPSTDEERSYEDIMRNHVLKVLKNPGDASWPPYREATWQEYGKFGKKKKCLVTSLDATNSYGAKLRYSVKIKFDADGSYKNFAMKGPQEAIYVDYHA